MNTDKFIPFSTDLHIDDRPEVFTFPFYYTPHPWAIMASEQLQNYLEHQQDFHHNFGLEGDSESLSIGKMFGVLVCENPSGEIGFLAGFSGKLANSNHHKLFVPPVYDVLDDHGFFRKEEVLVNELTLEIDRLEQSDKLAQLKADLDEYNCEMEQVLNQLKSQIKSNKQKRAEIRQVFQGKEEQFQDIIAQLSQLSVDEQLGLKRLKEQIKNGAISFGKAIDNYTSRVDQLKLKRGEMSADIQRRIFNEYVFLNAHGEEKSLMNIFGSFGLERPPAGAGECAAPKLLHYAYRHNLKPICMAEFWWGAPPLSEIRKHRDYYPSCRGKCEPILGHMLQGLQVDDNPLLQSSSDTLGLDIVYEDDDIIVVNKPAEFLSVPGKVIQDSVQTRLEHRYPDLSPLLVHRLDMSTSGILLAAKHMESHKYLQRQFIDRTVEKRYIALLEGVVKLESGCVELPLRVDLDDRPHQLVCYEYGKPAKTRFERINVERGRTRVYFYPETGRTHQLRVHSAHTLGLSQPIVGDDLYGTKSNRLHLHAEMLTFVHPRTRERMTFQIDVPF
jgi:tRNA pseudouridine32 synthase / 23S rRNA pseudouridine746 synthase